MQPSNLPEDTALHPLRPVAPPGTGPVQARRAVQNLVARYFFWSTALMCGAGALLLALATGDLPWSRRGPLVGLFALLGLLSVAGTRLRGQTVEWGVAATLALTTGAIALASVVLGWGLAAPGLAFYALFIFLLGAASGWRLAAALALLCLACLLAVYLLQPGGPAAPAGPAGPGQGLRLLVLLLLLVTGLLCGVLVSTLVDRYMRLATEREQRFAGLLAIAADAYWEIDELYHLVQARNQQPDGRTLTLAEGLGMPPWEMPQFGCDPEVLDALLADLDTRLPFRDRPVQWQHADGQVRHYMLSGEPRFNKRGVFAGYWGVARDVTDDVVARQALVATETRYEELFARMPNPLVLHQAGRIIDANPAALNLLGARSLDKLRGRDLLAAYESGDSRERARRRLDELEVQPPGTALPVSDFVLMVRQQQQRVNVRATGVRVQTATGPATLSIFVDDTERRAAEEAVRRSEAMLSHLVATSPDVITLTDLHTGRYAMVNRTFERITGYSAAEVVGQSAIKLGIWTHRDQRERFVQLLRDTGLVNDYPAQFNTKGGQVVPLLISGARFVMDRRDYLVINGRDVSDTERARLEREAILENASIGIAVTRDRRFVLANPGFEQMFGWPPGGLVGQPGSVVWPDAAAYEEVGQAAGPLLSRGVQAELERPVVRRDGSTFLARMLAKAVDPSHPARDGTVWIVEDVTERRQFEQKLAAARDAAEAANRAKSAFLANTSHELRTPINGMLHLAMLARDATLPPERRNQYLDQLADSARSLARIISDILDLSKIEAGRLQVDSAPFDLGELLRTVHQAYAPLAATRALALTLDLGENVNSAVLGDAQRLQQILGNYLSNALKFTATGGVTLRVRRQDRHVLFEVQDTGPGIPAPVLSRLFTPFTQADESTTRRYGGTGLGLSICRELATLMQGTVGVDSEPGQGSCFWARLPLPSTLLLRSPATTTNTPEGAAPVTDAAGLPVGDQALVGRRVLMAEDNPVNMLIGRALLERWGLVVEEASDGARAVDAVHRAAATGQPFAAVLMDVQMPVMSGHEATRALRHTEAGRQLPIIALTAAALVSEREAAVEAGMDDFLTKPIDADKLHLALLRWVARRHA
jgi:PAS domain S-box-containing protein